MASPGGSGSDDARKGEHHQSSSSGSSSRSTSSFASGDSSSTIRSSSSATEPTSLTIQLLEEITDNFSEERALGQGSYGKVYKGMLENGEEIAVKMLYNSMQAIGDEQFRHEFRNLRMLDHKNTVRLVGYCYETRRQHMDFEGEMVFGETTYKALCFEYMPMGSLQTHLSDETLGLDWHVRYKIIKGTCEGLKYLQEGFKEPIYHLDLKPDNILLDKNMVPKLADFGMSKLFGEEHTRVTQSCIGTIGYMPPEYLFGQVVSKKLDIFSLGVIITKIIAGPRGHTRSAEMTCQEFLDQVNQNWRIRIEATCTPQTREANCEQVSICTEIGLRCMDMDRHKRPSILDIIHILDVTETIIEKGTTLRRLLSNTTLDNNISAKVPASSYSVRSKKYWEIVKKNEKHDIPSHQEALARLCCRRIVEDALNSVDSREDYKLLKSKESPRRFKEISDTILESIIIMYDHETEKYDPKARDKEREYMVDKLRKVFIEDSRELIRKMLRKAFELFKCEYAKNLKRMEETDAELNYDDHMVDSCVEEFMNSCEDLKVFDSDYLYMKRGELQKQLHLYTVHHILTIKEIRGRKEVLQVEQRSHETVGELRKILQETTKEKQNAEAEADMTRQNEKQLKEELEHTRQMLSKQQESTLTEQREHMEKMLAAAHQEIQRRKATELAQQRFENSLEEMQTRLKVAIQQREHTVAEMAKQQEEYTLMMLAKQQEQAEKIRAAELQVRARAKKEVEELQKILEETTKEKQNAEADAEMTRQNMEQLEELERTRGMLAEQQKREKEELGRLIRGETAQRGVGIGIHTEGRSKNRRMQRMK